MTYGDRDQRRDQRFIRCRRRRGNEPYLQARPAKAKHYGVQVLNHALAGITGTTAVHICFGYAAIIRQRPSAYSFLHELEATHVQQISIEPQSHLDCKVLAALSSKTVLSGSWILRIWPWRPRRSWLTAFGARCRMSM